MATFDLSKKFYKIKEVSDLTGLPQSTIRYWEKEFPELAPERSRYNQRYFTPKDIETVRIIQYLVKDKGMKIEAAKENLKSNKKNLSRKLEIIEKLTKVNEELGKMLESLNKRGEKIGIEPEELSL